MCSVWYKHTLNAGVLGFLLNMLINLRPITSIGNIKQNSCSCEYLEKCNVLKWKSCH